MKYSTKNIIPSLLLILFFSLQVDAKIFSNKNYFRYNDQSYNYTILIPKKWKQTEYDLNDRFITIFTKNRYTEIKVTVSNYNLQQKRKWKNWRHWYIKDIGRRLHVIIQKNIIIKKKHNAKLLIFEYRVRRHKIMQKVAVIKYRDKIYTVECKSLLRYYHKYTHIFNNVIGSIMFEDY